MSTEKKDAVRRDKYNLHEPNEGLVKSYVEGLLDEFMCNPEVKLLNCKALQTIQNLYHKDVKKSVWKECTELLRACD